MAVPRPPDRPLSLPRSFFARDPLTCARELIGCTLHWGSRAGMVVETEAYDAEGDEASHTWSRPSAREFLAAHRPGTAYVYFNYGVHWMLNVLVKGPRQGFVLFRALEPLEGLEEMFAARRVSHLHQLCSGPGKLAKALGVTGTDHGRDLCADPAYGFSRPAFAGVVWSGPRIGISRAVDLPWRFLAQGNLHISVRPPRKRQNRPSPKTRPVLKKG